MRVRGPSRGVRATVKENRPPLFRTKWLNLTGLGLYGGPQNWVGEKKFVLFCLVLQNNRRFQFLLGLFFPVRFADGLIPA